MKLKIFDYLKSFFETKNQSKINYTPIEHLERCNPN